MTSSLPPPRSSRENSTTVRSNSTPLTLRALRSGLGLLTRVSPTAAAFVAERLFLTPRRHRRPEWERELLRSARAFRVPSSDGPLAAWTWDNDGPHVLLVHGWEGRGSQLGALVEPLLARGFAVSAFDVPGHGDSPGALSSFFHFARSIGAVARTLRPLHALVCHSMGGASAAWASREEPLAKRVVLIAPPADMQDYTGPASRMLGLNDAGRIELEARVGRRFGVPLTDIRATLVVPAMKTPALVLHDEQDRDVPIRSGEIVASAWPGAELVRTQGLGHRRILKDPRVIERIAEFLAADATRQPEDLRHFGGLGQRAAAT